MAESIDALQRQVNKLTQILQAQQSGLPNQLTVFVKGTQASSSEEINRIILERLSLFGLKDLSDAQDAGCDIKVIALPWLTDREIGHESV